MTIRRHLLMGGLVFGALISSATGAQAQSWTIIDYQPVHSTSVTPNRSPEAHRTAPSANSPATAPTQLPSSTQIATQTPPLTEEEQQVVIQQAGVQELAYTGSQEWSTFALALGLVGSGLIITNTARRA